MLSSVRSRILASYLFLAAAVLALVGLSFFLLLSSNPAASRLVYERLEAISALTLRAQRLQGQRQARALELAINQLGRQTGAAGLVLDSQGRVRFSTNSTDVQFGPSQLEGLRDRDAPQRGSFQSTNGAEWLYVAQPAGEGATLVVFAPAPTFRLIPFLIREFLPTLSRAAVVALVGSLALSLLMSRWIGNPLRRMAETIETAEASELRQGVALEGPLEVRSLAGSFNRMLERVRSSQQAMVDFVANVSHELKTPLTSIQGFAQAILDGTAADQAQRAGAARIIHEEAIRLKELVDDLLDLARMDAGELELDLEEVDLAELIRRVWVRFIPTASGRSIRLEMNTAGTVSVVADGDRLSQVFSNLIDNAVKYSPEGGRIGVSFQERSPFLLVHVQDYGPGIEPEQASRIFERFYREDRSRSGKSPAERGAGLGLSIASEIVQAHGGEIRVKSELGQGTRFTVALPVSRPGDETLARKRR